jgi:hypothetical protein
MAIQKLDLVRHENRISPVGHPELNDSTLLGGHAAAG